MTDPQACSALASHEPLAGTAPFARAWLVVEHPGPWGRDALRDSGVPPRVVEHIGNAQRDAPVRFLAARSIGHDRRGTQAPARRRVWLAVCGFDECETRTTVIHDWDELLDWNLTRMGQGNLPRVGDPLTESVEFVCTHSRRDACCAILGRELIASVPDHRRSRVWECSHLGGHRFAATSLFLPSGRLYGRLSAANRDHFDHGGEPGPEQMRGSSYLPAPLQAAECAARTDGLLPSSAAVQVLELESSGSAVLAAVSASTGGTWTISCEPDTVEAPASCGAPSEIRTVWRTEIIERGI